MPRRRRASTRSTCVCALRRVLAPDVPKMAMEDVDFHWAPFGADEGKEYEGVGPLFDEMTAHRLGLVPIPTDLALYNRREDCPTCHGEGCPNCTIIYSVNKRGPRSEEHTSELQSPCNLVCRLLLEKKKKQTHYPQHASQSHHPFKP